jgi:molybdopterin molybdotransferase
MKNDDLLSVDAARKHLLDNFKPLATEIIALDCALNRVLKTPIMATMDMPSFDNSSMDGFAIRSDDTDLASEYFPIQLKVTSDIPAGFIPDIEINPGETARIVTGAMMPKGTDAVIPVEETNIKSMIPGSKPPIEIRVHNKISKGVNVRKQGLDYKKGSVIINPNILLKPADIGVIASQGFSHITVHKKPVVGLLATGDELINPGELWKPGNIYDANTFILNALCSQGGALCFDLGASSDSEKSIKTTLDRAVTKNVDLILSTAGVSMGAYDYVRSVVEKEGQIKFWRINMRPGKPLLFGVYKGIPLIGLPGNPVSAYIGFKVFVRPVLDKLSGLNFRNYVTHSARLTEAIESDGRESYLRARIIERNGEWEATLTGHQGSGNLFSLVLANGLLVIPSGVKSLPKGSNVKFWFLD